MASQYRKASLRGLVRSIGEAGINITKGSGGRDSLHRLSRKTREQAGMVETPVPGICHAKDPAGHRTGAGNAEERTEGSPGCPHAGPVKKRSATWKGKRTDPKGEVLAKRSWKETGKKGAEKTECGVTGLSEPEKKLLKAFLSGKELSDEDLKCPRKEPYGPSREGSGCRKTGAGTGSYGSCKKAGTAG